MAYQQQTEDIPVQNVSLPAEILEAEGYYTDIIAKEQKTLQERDTANWVTSETVKTLAELDEAYQVMKDELLKEQNPRFIVSEMLENLRLRRQILEESIQLLEQSLNHQNAKQHEKSI